MIKKRYRASMTIEVTLIMSFILGIVVLIIFSGFMLHDRFQISKACMSAALRASEVRNDNEVNAEACEAFGEVVPSRLLGKWSYGYKVNIDEDEIAIEFSGKMQSFGGIIRTVKAVNDMGYSFSCRSYRLRESDYIKSKKKSGVGY